VTEELVEKPLIVPVLPTGVEVEPLMIGRVSPAKNVASFACDVVMLGTERMLVLFFRGLTPRLK
jgi:hypothetical protein